MTSCRCPALSDLPLTACAHIGLWPPPWFRSALWSPEAQLTPPLLSAAAGHPAPPAHTARAPSRPLCLACSQPLPGYTRHLTTPHTASSATCGAESLIVPGSWLRFLLHLGSYPPLPGAPAQPIYLSFKVPLKSQGPPPPRSQAGKSVIVCVPEGTGPGCLPRKPTVLSTCGHTGAKDRLSGVSSP